MSGTTRQEYAYSKNEMNAYNIGGGRIMRWILIGCERDGTNSGLNSAESSDYYDCETGGTLARKLKC
jgi:hypothetical protein